MAKFPPRFGIGIGVGTFTPLYKLAHRAGVLVLVALTWAFLMAWAAAPFVSEVIGSR